MSGEWPIKSPLLQQWVGPSYIWASYELQCLDFMQLRLFIAAL
jgi:hypothetical protein